jgi:prepilin-type processing-associated H-X9-DG protein
MDKIMGIWCNGINISFLDGSIGTPQEWNSKLYQERRASKGSIAQ